VVSIHVSQREGPVIAPSTEPARQALIPGAYERNTLTYRQAGSMSGPAYGASDLPNGPSLLDAATIAAREMEGGGGISQRPHRTTTEPQNGRTDFKVIGPYNATGGPCLLVIATPACSEASNANPHTSSTSADIPFIASLAASCTWCAPTVPCSGPMLTATRRT